MCLGVEACRSCNDVSTQGVSTVGELVHVQYILPELSRQHDALQNGGCAHEHTDDHFDFRLRFVLCEI